MDFLSILLIAIGLSADCFAVAIGGSITRKSVSPAQLFRLSLSFGIFQALMPALGWLAGQTIVDLIADYDHWVAFILLAGIGGKMLWESFKSEQDRNQKADITRGLLLITLSIATSIDALAVGLSFAFLSVNIAKASLIIGVTAFIITVIGSLAGVKAGQIVGKRAEAFGGIVLIAIGLRILITHLLETV
ncbi:MAG: manganese efflux pump [Chloroflexi bacterium]|nr:manganese efflux pump [Chloroflexota bacterium]